MHDWQIGYRTWLVEQLGMGEHLEHGLDLKAMALRFEYDEGYHYSSYTFADPSFTMHLSGACPCGDDLSAYKSGGDEISGLLATL